MTKDEEQKRKWVEVRKRAEKEKWAEGHGSGKSKPKNPIHLLRRREAREGARD